MHILHTGLSVKEYIYAHPRPQDRIAVYGAYFPRLFCLLDSSTKSTCQCPLFDCRFYETCPYHMTVFLITLEIIFLIVDTEITFEYFSNAALSLICISMRVRCLAFIYAPAGYPRSIIGPGRTQHRSFSWHRNFVIYGFVYGLTLLRYFSGISLTLKAGKSIEYTSARTVSAKAFPVFSHTVGMYGNNTQQQKCSGAPN